jgi:hypothetical protein
VFTLYFLRVWLRWLFGGLGAVVLEYAVLGWHTLFGIVAALTVAVVALVTWLIVIEWNAARKHGVDYRYEVRRRSNR